MINWTAFTWEAFATISTGIAAVIAATFVAIRQTSIAHRQLEFQEIAVRHDLFDRRMELVFKPLIDLFQRVFEGEKNDLTVANQMIDSIKANARLLFSRNVHFALEKISRSIAIREMDLENLEKYNSGLRPDPPIVLLNPIAITGQRTELLRLIHNEMSLSIWNESEVMKRYKSLRRRKHSRRRRIRYHGPSFLKQLRSRISM